MIQTIQHEILKSAELTGQWEKRLRMIERSNYQSQTFMTELKTMVATLVQTVKNDYGKTISIEEKEKEAPKKQEKKSTKKTEGKKESSKSATPPKDEAKAKKVETRPDNDNHCPICHTGLILKGNAAFGCSNWNTGCKFRIPFVFEGHTFTSDELTKLTKMETIQIGEKKVKLSAEGVFESI